MLFAHGGSGQLEMFATGGFMLLVALVVVGGIVIGMLTRHDDGSRRGVNSSTKPGVGDEPRQPEFGDLGPR